MCAAFDTGDAGPIGNTLDQFVYMVAKALIKDPSAVFFTGKGTGAKMNGLRAFVFQYFCHINHLITGTAAGKEPDQLRTIVGCKSLGTTFKTVNTAG